MGFFNKYIFLLWASLGGVLILSSIGPAQATEARKLTVFAAASLRDVLEDIAKGWGAPVVFSFAGSSSLARQIEHGAPADIFISANIGWLDHLSQSGLIDKSSRRDLARNRLALVRYAPLKSAPSDDPCDALSNLGEDWVAMALIDAVPAGIYGRSGLQSLGCWAAVADRVAQAGDVRAALALVARGGAAFGVVYATELTGEDAVHVAAWFPEDSHEPIVYPAALINDGTHPEAADFLAFLSSPAAGDVFRRHGFLEPE